MTPPVPPEQNIGPYYRVVGAVLLLLFVVIVVGLVAPLIGHGQAPSDGVAKILAGLAGVDFFGFLLITVRPKRFDDVFRMIVAALPFTKYQGPPA